MRFNIRTKLLAGFGIVLLIMVAMGVSAYLLTGSMYDSQQQVNESMEQNNFIVEKEIDHLVWTNNLADTLILGEKFTGGLDPTQCQFGQWYYDFIESDQFEQLPNDVQDILLNMKKPHENLHKSAQRIIEINEEYGTETEQGQNLATSVYNKQTKKYLNQVQGLLGDYQDFLANNKEQAVQQSEKNLHNIYRIIIMLTAASLIIGLSVALFINHNLTKPIKEFVDFLKSLAKSGGDLTREIEVSNNDEIGDLAYWFNRFINKL